MCSHVSAAEIEADRENLKDSVFRIKHGAEWLYDAGDSMISLEQVRALLDDPPAIVAGRVTAFCDFAGPGDQSVLALCEGNSVRIVDGWVHRDTMHSVGKFINWFKKLGLRGYQIGGDEGYGHQLMDRMAEEGYHLKRVNNGSAASKPNLYVNLAAEWWSVVGEKIEHREIVLPRDEKLVAQLSSRRKLYDSKGRERLESKADMRARGLESPDLADAVIVAVMMNRPSLLGLVTSRREGR
jgi:phage terminase large subunit